MSDEKLLSAVKLDLYWVSFKDKAGNIRNRMALKNPTGRTLLWDVGGDRGLTIPTGEAEFEVQENLKVERMDNQTLTRSPEWLEKAISDKTKDTKHFVEKPEDKKAEADEKVKESAEKASKLDDPLGAIGGISGGK